MSASQQYINGPGTSRLTRIIAMLLVPFLLAAGVILYLFPDNTAELFAWTITPRMTPLIMGAGFLAGTYFFLRIAMGARRDAVMAGLLSVAVFAWISGITTVLHWDRFNHNHVTFGAWAVLYAITPFLVPVLWWLNRTGPDAPLHPFAIPRAIAVAIGIVGVVLAVVGIALFLVPDNLIPLWPWTLTPLTARVMGSWFTLSGLQDISIATHRRWQTVRLILQAQLIGLALIVLAIPRALDVLNWANPLAAVFAIGMVVLLIGLAAVYVMMSRQAAQTTLAQPVQS